jgi:hypothetical protein
MKKLALLFCLSLLTIVVKSQDLKISLKENQLIGNVIKVEEYSYKYDDNLQGYYNESISEMHFNKYGYLTKKVYHYYGSYYQSQSTTTYSYNANNLLINDATETISLLDNKTSSSATNYTYLNNKLVKKEYVSSYPTTVTYSYDSFGNLFSEVHKNSTGETTAIYNYSNYKNSNTYTKVYNYFYKGNQESTTTYNYVNGNISSYNYVGKTTSSNYAYNYDSYGNNTEILLDGKISSTNNYQYHSDGNWLQKKYSYNSTYSNNPYNVFWFKKITYANGKTAGYTNLNASFIKKYEQRDSYDLKVLEKKEIVDPLADPEQVNKIYVLKTEGTKFKVKTDKDVYLTSKVNAIKHTNTVDMVLYHPKSNTTAIVYNFNDELTRQDVWMEATILSNTHHIFWNINESKNWFITDKGAAFSDYNLYTVKYSTTNPNDVIMYKNDVPTYIMRNFKNAVAHKLYVLEKL